MKFYQLSPEQRRKKLLAAGIKLDAIDDAVLSRLDKLSENVIGQLRLPVGLVQKAIVNQQKYVVPMATEEPSVVAAANHGMSIFAKNGGVIADSKRNGIFGQIVLKINKHFSLETLKTTFPDLIKKANQQFNSLVKHGGGLKKIQAEVKQDLLYLKVLVDPAEAMGANKTNSILEYLAAELENYAGIDEKMFAILSNYPSQLTTAKIALDPASVGGLEVAQRIALLSQIAHDNPYRAVTNNKGIMNGVDAVLLATGNDYRAVEAACGVLANQDGQYRSLSKWTVADNKLCGEVTLPLAIGTVGGSISAREDVQQVYRILGKVNTKTLAEIIASVGLANNLAAILAISTSGIQAGHMKLQARNLVATLKANDEEKKQVLKLMRKAKKYSMKDAEAFLKEVRGEK
ncbi:MULTISPECIES: hydroxymethylglutaryl-CoA reductase, degradative [Lactobacillus]|uniref:hydroxymethylglutaryl-CoA reductase, degradative n=1 Tax=Lactobacillus TaxID=1578 RepID=UPI002491871F|nr:MULTISPECIES: hydroxymethylglutaryl-CoA reductase, degradative [Lactobacillus]